jgi:hypothetical protein
MRANKKLFCANLWKYYFLLVCLGCCRWISCRKNTGYHATDPKIRTQGAERVRSRIATKYGDGSLESSNALHTAERDAELYPGSGPSWWGKAPTSCLLVLRRDTSRGVQGLGYKALAAQRLKNLRAQLAAWRRRRFDPPYGVASPPFIAPRSSFPLSSWGRGCHTRPRREDSCRLHSSMDVVFVE